MTQARAKIRYPRKSEIQRAIEAGRACGLDVAGYEVGPDGIIRIMEPRARQNAGNDFDRWADRL